MFTDSLIYMGMLYLVILRTNRYLCSRTAQLKYPREFKAFYILVWVNLFLTFVLYILASANFTFNSSSRPVTVVALYLLPIILEVLCYALLYQMLDNMMIDSHLENSQMFITNRRQERCRKCLWITTVCTVAFFVVCQLAAMVLCLFKIITPIYYLVFCNGLTAIVIVGLNANQVGVYCKFSGQPYKSQAHFEKVRKLGLVCGIWTVAYIIKVFAIFYGSNILSLSDQTTISLATACTMALTDFFTIIVPYYCVIDSDFV
jgi:hypothetical protein